MPTAAPNGTAVRGGTGTDEDRRERPAGRPRPGRVGRPGRRRQAGGSAPPARSSPPPCPGETTPPRSSRPPRPATQPMRHQPSGVIDSARLRPVREAVAARFARHAQLALARRRAASISASERIGARGGVLMRGRMPPCRGCCQHRCSIGWRGRGRVRVAALEPAHQRGPTDGRVFAIGVLTCARVCRGVGAVLVDRATMVMPLPDDGAFAEYWVCGRAIPADEPRKLTRSGVTCLGCYRGRGQISLPMPAGRNRMPPMSWPIPAWAISRSTWPCSAAAPRSKRKTRCATPSPTSSPAKRRPAASRAGSTRDWRPTSSRRRAVRLPPRLVLQPRLSC